MPVIFVRDSLADRVFLGMSHLFPLTSLLSVEPDLHLLTDHSALTIPLPDLPPRPEVLPKPASRVLGVKPVKIPRPPNAFILYRKDHQDAVKAVHPGIHNNQICELRSLSSSHVTHSHNSIAVILGAQWQEESPAVRAQYKGQADQLKEEHKAKYPTYQYQPRKSAQLKRRMTRKKIEALDRAKNVTDTTVPDTAEDHDFTGLKNSWSADQTDVLTSLDNFFILKNMAQHNARAFDHPEKRFEDLQTIQDQNDRAIHAFSSVIDYDGVTKEETATIPWGYIRAYQGLDEMPFDASVEEFIDPRAWAGFGADP